jgi:hypothetical protein
MRADREVETAGQPVLHRRCDSGRSLVGFQICPHPRHRQYVLSEIVLLVVVTSTERQKGHGGFAVTTAATGWLRIVDRPIWQKAERVFPETA